MVYIQLFLTYLRIGLFGFGGGYAMLSLIQTEVVTKHQWLGPGEFTDIVAISQMTPGPIGINSATYIGYVVTGSIWGSAVATFAVCLPSFAIMLLACKFFVMFRNNFYIEAALSWLRPAIAGLIAAAALMLANRENFVDSAGIIIFAVSFLLTWKWKLHPILLILIAGAAGWIIY
ncbi:MAG: chromate transporter [Bacteroidales bacterium]|jgi:chromate transporter|nr:chromate transporter [Bacteroidales bacterium]